MNRDHYENFAEEWAQRMRDGKNITHEYLCKPALFDAIGNVVGKVVLCVGCGSGEECKKILDLGATKVVGIDLSPSLIEIAKRNYPEIDFFVLDMEEMDFDISFDLIVSNLTMHYVPSWTKTLERMKKLLSPEGEIIISTNHPIRFGAETKRMPDKEVFLLGYIRYMNPGEVGDVIGDYLNERKVKDVWFRGRFEVEYYHRPLSAIFADIASSNLKIKKFIEPIPPTWVSQKEKSFYHIHTKIPLFMIFVLNKA